MCASALNAYPNRSSTTRCSNQDGRQSQKECLAAALDIPPRYIEAEAKRRNFPKFKALAAFGARFGCGVTVVPNAFKFVAKTNSFSSVMRNPAGSRTNACMGQVVVSRQCAVTPNGKLDTRAPPVPEYTAGEYRAPANAIEEMLANIYAQVLDVERVGVDDSFFDLGGESISAMRVIAAINNSMDAGLAVRTVFDSPTVRSLSQRLRTDTTSAEELVPLQSLKKGSG